MPAFFFFAVAASCLICIPHTGSNWLCFVLALVALLCCVKGVSLLDA